MAKPLLSRVQALDSLAMMKDAIAGTETSDEGFYNFAFHVTCQVVATPLSIGAAAVKAICKPNWSTK